MERRFPNPRPIAIEFFCGAGGMSLGFEQAGFDIILGVDTDGHHVATHERNFPYGKSLCASVVDLTGKYIRKLIERDGDIDLVVGGPPCQGFSHMGLRDLRDPRNSLIDHFIRLVLELRPKAMVMENVPGLATGKMRKVLDAAIELLRDEGYNVTLPVQILDAANFGVPQSRRRLFILATRGDVGQCIDYPSGACPGQPTRPTVWEAISDLPSIERYERLFKENDAPYSKRPISEYGKVARGLVIDPSDVSHPRIWNEALCNGCLRTKHAEASAKLYEATPPGEIVPGHKLPRLNPNGIAPTLRAGSDSTHGSYTAPRPIHPRLPRCITSREAARLHGFPDWFAFYPLKWHAYRQIGNAVCPPVARAIGYSIRTTIGGRATKRIPTALPLGSDFHLPPERPKTLKRIPQIEQFPPVIEHLFGQAFDKKNLKLQKPQFTFQDVQLAIAATGVNLHWTRSDTFLAEIARSRRVREMLAPALSNGYTIKSITNGKVIGEFVPAGTPGTLEQKDSLKLRIDEFKESSTLPLTSIDLNGNGWGILAILTQPTVQEALWNRTDCVIGLVESQPDENQTKNVQWINCRIAPKFRPKIATVVTCTGKTLPTKSRIVKLASARQCGEVLVLIKATERHLVALRFDDCENHPREIARGSFLFK